MQSAQQYEFHVYLSALRYLKYHINRVAKATVTHLPAFLSFQTLKVHFNLFETVHALSVSIAREGPGAEKARRVLNYSKLRYRFVMSNSKQRLGFVLRSVSLHYKTFKWQGLKSP
jgi:hypothetical protein